MRGRVSHALFNALELQKALPIVRQSLKLVIRVTRSMCKSGLFAAIGGGAASQHHPAGGAIKDGPELPLTHQGSFCGRSPLCGHSLQVRAKDFVEFTQRGQTRL